MIGLLRAEGRKAFSTWMWVALTAAAVGFTTLNAGSIAVLAGTELGQGLPSLESPDGIRFVLSTAGSASLLALILGIISMTAEYRHHTVTSTFLATPRRWPVLVAKTGVQFLLAALLGVLCSLTALAVLAAVFAFRDHASIDWSDYASVLGATTLGFAIYAVLGVGFGAFVRNQIAAVTAAIVWVMLVEALIVGFLPQIGKWLPGGALNAVLQVDTPGQDSTSLLATPTAAAVLIAWGVAFAGLAAATTLRRDIS